MIEDCDAYVKYPQHRKWFNKLWLSETLGYKCGPAGTDIPEDGIYVIRPIYNLAGMGACAEVKELKKDDYTSTPPGYFWCEYFKGKHYSADYKWVYNRDHIDGSWNNPWKGISCWVGTNMPLNLTKFVHWKRSDYIPQVPNELVELKDVEHINVEFIEDKVIEVHLRETPDPDYDEFIPVWKSDEGKVAHYLMHEYKFIEAYDDANGYIKDPRIGFLVK